MPFCEWDDENWNTLINAIKDKKCILMLGPDVPCEIVEGEQRPLTEILAKQLAAMIDEKARETINTSDLAQVAECFSMIERDRNKLVEKVSDFYNQRKDLCSNLYRNLAALPFYLTVTTTPDFMFYKAMKEEGKEPITKFYNFKKKAVNEKESEDKVKIGTDDKTPLIFHLYGTIEKPDSLVITENDILDFLVGLVSKNPPMQEDVLRELRDESKSFLFLGFGFKNWYLRILLHVLNGRNKQNSSFAMEQFIPRHIDLFKQTVFFFQKSNYKIHIFNKDFDDFTALLREKHDNKINLQCHLTPRKSSLNHQKQPLVFISHKSEDTDFALLVYDELKNADLNPWLDKNNLESGCEWDKEIRKILKTADYFVILNSKNLAKKYDEYIFREIHFALERKTAFRRGIRFIFPVRIDDTPLIEELEEIQIQAIDLTQKNSFVKLIEIIKRDYKKREDYEKQR